MATEDSLNSSGILHRAADWQDGGHAVALATVTRTRGSSPRPVGSLLAVNDRREFVGSVSGGCIEGEVIEAALEAMRTGQCRQLAYEVSNERAWEVGLACGGRVEIYVEPLGRAAGMKRVLLDRLLADQAAKRPVALLTRLSDGRQALVHETSEDSDPGFEPALIEQARRALRADRSETVDGVFIRVFNPPLRLIVVGAVHIARALIPMACLAGYAVTVIEPRPGWLAGNRLTDPDIDLSEDWPDRALEVLAPDRRTAVVTLSHDPKLDDPALRVALRSPAFYVGALGSRRTDAARRERLREAGLSEADLGRLHAPVGLAIGARSPAEIAVSILAELIRQRHSDRV